MADGTRDRGGTGLAAEIDPIPVIDPITLEIMRNRWLGIAEECCAALVRASYSTNIKDRRDCSVALATSDGVIVAQAEVGTPLHLGIMPGVLGAILTEFPPDAMQPGDMYASNLPYPEGRATCRTCRWWRPSSTGASWWPCRRPPPTTWTWAATRRAACRSG